jgi:site-specific DNA-methyltransferase (adenine-specific)
MNKKVQSYLPETQIRLIEDARKAQQFYHKSIPFTQPWVCEEITRIMRLAVDDDIVVMFTIEWAVWLKHNGFNKITVLVDEPCDFTKKACDFWGFEYKIYEQGSVMKKFDAVVGNPPYDKTTDDSRQREFYQQFVYQAHELGDHIGLIFPARWTSVNNATYKKFSNFLLDANMTHFKWLPTNAFPDIQMLTCYVITDQTTKCSLTTVEDQQGQQGQVDLRALGYYPSDLTTISLLTKLNIGSNIAWRASAGSLYENQLVNGTNKIVFRTGRKEDPITYYNGDQVSAAKTALVGNHKVVISRNGAEKKLGPAKVCDQDAGVGFACFGLKTQSQKQSQTLVEYLDSKIVKFIIDQYKRGTKGNSKELFSKIPDIDLNKTWTDSDLYQHFNLTVDEIEFINNNY